jgi:hypothetical protein
MKELFLSFVVLSVPLAFSGGYVHGRQRARYWN